MAEHPAPESAPRVAGYVRVSSLGQVEDGYSLEAQRQAIGRYCAAHGWAEPTWYEDAGISAHNDDPAKRPAFAKLLADIDAGVITVVVVHKLDRWARSVVVSLSTLKRLEEHGCSFISIGENLDFTGPFGRAVLGVLAIFAQLYSDNLSTEVKKGLAEKQRQGLHVGRIPYGALRIGGRLVPDPERAPTLARILAALAGGDSAQRIADALNAEGIPGPRAEHWGASGIEHMRGAGGRWLLTQPAPWPERRRAALHRPRVLPLSRNRQPQMLAGLLRCACGGLITYHSVKHHPRAGHTTRYGRCRNSTRPGRRGCTDWGRTISQIEAYVTAWLLALPAPVRLVPLVSGADLAREHEDKRRAIVELRRDGLLTDREYEREKAALAALAARLPRESANVEALGRGLRDAQRHWGEANDADRNGYLRGLVDHILVDHGAIRVALRPQLATFWDDACLRWPRVSAGNGEANDDDLDYLPTVD